MHIKDRSPFNFSYSFIRIFLRNLFIVGGIACMYFSLISLGGLGSGDARKTLWIVDVSLSMVVQDITEPNGRLLSRLDLAKNIMLSGSEYIPGEQALLTFGEQAKLILPFSTSKILFSQTVKGIEPILYGSATDLTQVLMTQNILYGDTPRHIILLTDGEDTLTGGSIASITSENTTFSLIGIGTESGGPMLQGYDATGMPRYKQYEGKNALSHLDKTRLESLAESLDADLYMISTSENLEKVVTTLGESHIANFPLRDSVLSILGAIFLLFGLMLHPYSTKK